MGKPNPQMSRLFCGTVSVHLLLALFVLIVFESFGLWFLNTQLNIAPDRLTAANWVFQCSVITFCVKLISVPYHASIIAHERMDAFAYIGIYEVLAKLGIVYLLWLSNYDKLIVYALLMLTVSISMRLIYGLYCTRNFEECHFDFVLDRPLLREMLGFSGWNFIGSTAGILSTHGINILINIFFGVALNAARGVVEQANHAINTFVTNFMTAMNPQITKSCAAGNYSYMNTLMIKGAKFSAICYWLMAVTFFFEADIILDIWLVEVPAYAPIFFRLAIIYSIFRALANTIYTGMLATGNIRIYQIIMGSLYFTSFLLCYFFFLMGLGPEFGYISTIIIAIIQLYIRLVLIAKLLPSFSKKRFFIEAISKSIIVVLLSSLTVYVLKNFLCFQNRYIELISMFLISICCVFIITYIVALSESERHTLSYYIKSRIK